MDYLQDINDLLVKHRADEARRRLYNAGPLALPAIRSALRHESAEVRWFACGFFDHFLDEEALPELIRRLDDEDARVRERALHTLACERCKEGECRPGEEMYLPTVLKMLESDPSPHLRRGAINLLFQIVHRSAQASAALERARDEDPAPDVRAYAATRAPRGVMWRRTSPNPKDRRGLRTSNSRKRLTVK
jgi:HEAT repeat protein